MKLPGMDEKPRKGNNGYVVFNLNIPNQLGNTVVVSPGKRYSARPFIQQASGQIFKDGVEDFPPPLVFSSF